MMGTDAPICQDTPSGGLDDLLTSAEVGHDARVDFWGTYSFTVGVYNRDKTLIAMGAKVASSPRLTW